MRRLLLTIFFTIFLLEMVACEAGPITPRLDSGPSAENSLPPTIELFESADFNLKVDTFNVIYDKERDVTCWIVYQGDGYNSGLGIHCLKGKHRFATIP